jgi:cell division protein FtsQ
VTAARTPTRSASRPNVVSATDRLDRRSRSRSRRRWLRVLVVLLIALAFAGAAWALGWSHVLGVRSVEVVGEHRATEGLVLLTADVQPGTPLARVDTGAVADRVRSLLVVDDATVQRVWPNTLRITVVERSGVAVARRGDVLRLLDHSGVDFASVAQRPAALPFLDVDLLTTNQDEVAAALAVVDGLPVDLRRRVSAVEVHSPDDVRLRMGSGAVVLWGDASQGEQKAEVLQALLHTRADQYDVRAPLAPTTAG